MDRTQYNAQWEKFSGQMGCNRDPQCMRNFTYQELLEGTDRWWRFSFFFVFLLFLFLFLLFLLPLFLFDFFFFFFFKNSFGDWGLRIDGVEVKEDPRILIQQGQFSRVPVIIGYNREVIFLFFFIFSSQNLNYLFCSKKRKFQEILINGQ